MTEEQKAQTLRVTLTVVGVLFIFAIWTFMQIWPSGWQWQPSQPEYEQMIMGVYATLGIFLILAARDPRRHRSLVLFAAWSSLVHAGIMAVQAIRDSAERGHLVGDVPALALIGIVLLLLAPATADTSG